MIWDYSVTVKVIQVLNLSLRVSVKLLCGLEASQGAVEEVVSSAASVNADALDSSDELDPEEDGESETKVARKKKNKRRKGIIWSLFKVPARAGINWTQRIQHFGCTTSLPGCLVWCLHVVFTESSESSDGGEYPVDIWLVLASYIRPEDVCRFALICRNAWTVTCTAAFWTRLYRRWGGFIDLLHAVSGENNVQNNKAQKWSVLLHAFPTNIAQEWSYCDVKVGPAPQVPI